MVIYRPLRRLLPIAVSGGILLCVLALAQQNGDPAKPAPARQVPTPSGESARKPPEPAPVSPGQPAQKIAEPAPASPGQAAQKPSEPAGKPDEDPNIIRVQADEVILPVTVKDAKGRFISNLVASDFRVLDEGRPQRISFFSHTEKQPIVVGFLVDQSSNVAIHWDKFKEAVRELVWNLLPGDPRYTGYLIQYANKAELLVNTTRDSDKIAEQVAKMKPGGGAALFDAIYRACTDRALVLGEPYEPRRVIIVIGDGHDTASSKTQAEVLELAKRNQVTIFAISTMNFGFANPDEDVLAQLTTETGGHVEYPLNNLYKGVSGYLSTPSDDGNYALTVGTGGYASEISSHIIQAITGISAEITTQYVLRYTPDFDRDAKPKEYRHIKVELPAMPWIKPLTRDGYYPGRVGATTADRQ
jgi:VWFA-related protein